MLVSMLRVKHPPHAPVLHGMQAHSSWQPPAPTEVPEPQSNRVPRTHDFLLCVLLDTLSSTPHTNPGARTL